MNETQRRKSRFERRPLLTILACLVFLALAFEGGLRLVNPAALEFAYEFRQLYRYDPDIYIDFLPETSRWLRMSSEDGTPFLNFLITTTRYGFRHADRELDNALISGAPGMTYIHAIGDSMTMGWGCGHDSSYPAQLDTMLDRKTRVLNLGINGFGTIGATEKSRRIWTRFPASRVFYVFTDNDFTDDEDLLARWQRPTAYHAALGLIDLLRRHFYAINLPLAIHWYRYRAQACAGIRRSELTEWKPTASDNTERFEEIGDSPPPPERVTPFVNASMNAILDYSLFAKERGATLTVILPEAESAAARAMFSFCRRNSIDAHLLRTPPSFRLRGEGHFSPLGNLRLAEYVKSLIDALASLELKETPTTMGGAAKHACSCQHLLI